MDINVARTFLEVVKTGSFVNAADNLNLTQTAVSARVRRSSSGFVRYQSIGCRSEHDPPDLRVAGPSDYPDI